MKRMACVIALAAGTGIALGATAHPALGAPLAATADSGLKLGLAAPKAATGDSTITLDLNFSGGNIRSVELYVDVSLIKKQAIRTREGHGIISFALEAALLSEGDHEILIKAFDQNGNAASAGARVSISTEETNALMRFLYPRKNATLQGVVPIQIQLDRSIRNPYVMFFVDNDFLALVNYAPFTYNWDSTRVVNGEHILSVKVVDGETTAEVQNLTLKVTVNNPGGFTKIQKTTPDLNASAPKVNGPGIGLNAEPATLEMPVEISGGLARNIVGMKSPAALRQSRIPSYQPGNAFASNIKSNPVPHRFTPVTVPIHSELFPLSNEAVISRASPLSVGTPNVIVSPTTNLKPAPINTQALRPSLSHAGALELLSNPNDLASLNVVGQPQKRLAHQPVRVRRAGNIAALPGMLASPYAQPVRVATVAVKRTNRAGLPGFTGKTFEVAFDNTMIAFDVPPRVENGLPLAPFRAIFEHTGGKVEYYNRSKTIRAFNETREIEFKVGQTEAKVNNTSLNMETKSYIDQGRAIVPLSFVRDALNVSVNYDPQTGRLRIESKK